LMPKNSAVRLERLQTTVQKSQRYDPHFDYFFHEGGFDNGGNRLLTVLIYLTDVEAGGETVFPNIRAPASQMADHFSECAMQGLAVTPRKGNAVVFWSLTTAGELNHGSLHGSCPVLKGEKFSATKWYHVAHYAMGSEQPEKVHHRTFVPPPPPAPEGCVDENADCTSWAESGECEANAPFMVGTARLPGKCLFSCARCDLMPPRIPGSR
jgi:prolyl 4-hydroxylase